jgi:BirA family transcriptional regulator, biotin operon repressor / biotin---[acetyl-CoA-carboxylase] ligase
MNFTILRYDSIGSTNDEALRQARMGVDEGLCFLARHQTAGRGRHGRAWVSPPGAGLHFSIILRPTLEMRFLSLITLMTGVAVHDMLEEIFGLDCDIKWANDIHVRGKKICGILAESCETNKGQAVVVGIGINLKSANFPAELSDIITSVEAEIGQAPELEILLKALTVHLAKGYEILQSADGAADIREAWRERSSYAVGKQVRVVLENETIFGVTRGIEENGALRVETESGEIKIVQAGDVENLRMV